MWVNGADGGGPCRTRNDSSEASRSVGSSGSRKLYVHSKEEAKKLSVVFVIFSSLVSFIYIYIYVHLYISSTLILRVYYCLLLLIDTSSLFLFLLQLVSVFAFVSFFLSFSLLSDLQSTAPWIC